MSSFVVNARIGVLFDNPLLWILCPAPLMFAFPDFASVEARIRKYY
jgi:hypothetical protein